jgi:DNA-binding transcriptional LysR family regulator
MERFASMRSFRAVLEHQGFAAAAKALGVSKTTISKQVTALEVHLGATLLHRTTRRLSPTEAGRAFYADAVRILDDLAGAEERVAEDQGVPRGLLRINAPLSFSVARLMPVVSAFMARHRQVRIDLALDDRPVDPVGHAFDLSLRIRTALDDSVLMSRRIGGIAHVVCVTRDYPAPPPQRPEDLVDHPMLVYGSAPTHDYRFETITGRSRVAIVRIIPALRTNNSLAIREALLSGTGVAVIPRFVVDRDLAEGRLVPLLAEWRLRDHALFALFTDGRAPPAKLRNFLEMLVERRRVLTDF